MLVFWMSYRVDICTLGYTQIVWIKCELYRIDNRYHKWLE